MNYFNFKFIIFVLLLAILTGCSVSSQGKNELSGQQAMNIENSKGLANQHSQEYSAIKAVQNQREKRRKLTCGQSYTIEEGDTLGSIAKNTYGSAFRWNFVLHANRSVLGNNPHRISEGTRIFLPCESEFEREVALNLNEEAESKELREDREDNEKISILIGSYPPFTGDDLPEKGMTSQIVAEAFNSVNQPFRVVNINEFSSHLNILLKERLFDMGHPWFKPNCDDPQIRSENATRCEYLFSDPVYEALVLFWKRADDPFNFLDESEVHGKHVCRPKGWFTHDIDHWIINDRITLAQPATLRECFRMLLNNEVDLVTDQELGGVQEISDLGVEEKIVRVDQPVSVLPMHMLIHKSHPQASEFLSTLNKGLDNLRKKGRINEISEEHLYIFYENL